MPVKPRILKTNTLLKTRLFTIEEVQLRFANGEERIYERLHSEQRTFVTIVPLLDRNTILLISEYAAGTDRYELGFPKGLVERDEDPLQAAHRELREEVGYDAKNMRLLTSMTSAPGYSSGHTLVVIAQDLYEDPLVGDEPEPIVVVPWKLDNLQSLLTRDDFSEARSIAALFWVKELLNNEQL